MKKFNLIKPNKSSPYFQLIINQPRAMFISKSPNYPLEVQVGLSKKELNELRKVIPK